MKHIKFLSVIVLLLVVTSIKAQSSENTSLSGDVPIDYMANGNDKIDIYYEYKIWRTLMLSETPNQPLALPKEPVKGRKNLGIVILESIGNEHNPIPVFEVSDQEMENDPRAANGVYSTFQLEREVENRCFLFQPSADKFTIIVNDGDPRMDIPKDSLFNKLPDLFQPTAVRNILTNVSNQIYKYDIYEVWFFNKRYSTFKSEIRAICPYIIDKASGQSLPIGWMPFDQLRRYLVQVPIKLSDWHATTGMNQYSMDAYFTSKLYSGEIVQAENLQGKKFIDYNNSPEQIAKQRQEIETRLINLEEDIWAY